MNRIKKVFRLVHIVLWILLTLLVAFQLQVENPYWIRLTVGFILTCLYVFYGQFYLLTIYLGKNKKRAYLIRLAGIMLTGPLIFLFFHYRNLDTWQLFFGYYGMTFISMVTIFTFLGRLAKITENLVLNTIRKEQLEKQAVKSELQYLKSQINPHFLFNTLNNIHTLVYKQAPAAPEAVMRLSSLMRYMIYESNALEVPLTVEINYLQDYISLQQLRYKASPIVDFRVELDSESLLIAPLLFIHLLENAYKHSPSGLEAGSIKVRVTVNQNSLILTIQNPIGDTRGHKLEEPGGIGLPNVQKRLQLIYPDQHSLTIHKTDDIFTIELKITDLQTQVHERKTQLLYN